MIPHADRLRVVLVDVRNPLNIGAAARAISNFGFAQLDVVNPYEVAYQEAKSAVNAGAILEQSRRFATLAEALTDVTFVLGTTSVGPRVIDQPLYRLEAAAPLVREKLAAGPVALLFGSEKFGLSNHDLSFCHALVRIPTRVEHHSMNLGQSVAVCLYELIRDPQAVAPAAYEPADGEQVERFVELLQQALTESSYIDFDATPSALQKMRRMVHRLNLTMRDTYVWLGMLRQILWKLRQ